MAAVVTVALGALMFPDVLGLDRVTPLAQLVSLRPYTVAGVAVVAVILGVAARSWRWVRPFLAGTVVVALAGVAVLIPRAVPTDLEAEGRTLTVAAFNTFDGSADPGALAALIGSERPDLVSLLEAGAGYRARLAPLVEPMGYRLYTSAPPQGGELHSVTAVVSTRLGAVRAEFPTGMPFRPVEITGGGLGPLRFLAYHAVAPRRGDVPQWRSDLMRLPRWCAGPTPAIVAGDFNATLDNSVFRDATAGCSDAAAQRGAGLVPTWPTWLPDWIGPQIDHILATGGISATMFSTREIPGSDHRVVLTRVRPAG